MEIRQIREALRLTQEEFARRVGCSYSAILRWEHGERVPTVKAYKAKLQKLEERALRARS